MDYDIKCIDGYFIILLRSDNPQNREKDLRWRKYSFKSHPRLVFKS